MRKWYDWPPSHKCGMIFHDVEMGWQSSLSWLDVSFITGEGPGHFRDWWAFGVEVEEISLGSCRVEERRRPSGEHWSRGRMTSLWLGSQACTWPWKISIGLGCPVLCSPLLKHNKDLLYNTGNYVLYLVITYNGKKYIYIYIYIYTHIYIYMYIYIWLNHFAAHQKLTQYCKPTILQ